METQNNNYCFGDLTFDLFINPLSTSQINECSPFYNLIIAEQFGLYPIKIGRIVFELLGRTYQHIASLENPRWLPLP